MEGMRKAGLPNDVVPKAIIIGPKMRYSCYLTSKRRKWKRMFCNICFRKNTKSNIFTTGVHIIADMVTNLQTRTELKPIFWKTFSDENEKHGEMG